MHALRYHFLLGRQVDLVQDLYLNQLRSYKPVAQVCLYTIDEI